MSADFQPPSRSVEDLVQVPMLGDPAETITAMRSSVRKWDAYWGERFPDPEDPAPAAQEAAQIRRMLRGFLAPKLDELASSGGDHLSIYLNLMIPFDTRGGLRDFMLHFFQLAEDGQGGLIYEERGKFERDVYVLYDLYRVKKTLEVVGTLREARKIPERIFSSIFQEAEIAEILDSIESVLGLMFSQCLPEQHLRDLLPKLSPRFIKSHSLLDRRENEILYTFPHVLEKYVYRRFFFLIYFKDGLKARVDGGERDFRYSFVKFQVIKHEFLVHWLSGPLRNDPRKYKIYQRYLVQGKTLLEWISEEPAKEQQILTNMSAETLNGMASQVNDALPEEMKIGAVPESKDFGFYHQLKENLASAVDMVRAPIETLRKIVEDEGPPPPDEEEEGPTLPPAKPVAAPPAAQVEPHWEVTLLKKSQVPKPFLADSIADFAPRTNQVKAKLGSDWKGFSSYVSDLLEKTPEIATIRRRTPKHEWTMPYRLRWIASDVQKEYLLVLGAEVKARPRGMGFQSDEAYNFVPYFVFATNVEDEDYGDSSGERMAAGVPMKEFLPAHPAVPRKVVELLGVLRENEK